MFEDIRGVSTRVRRIAGPQDATIPPLIALHGWGERIESLALLEELSDITTVVLVDLPGFGEADPPPGPWDTTDYARFVAAVAEHCGIARFSLLGHSFGGRLAIRLATELECDLDRLVLVASAGVKDPDPYEWPGPPLPPALAATGEHTQREDLTPLLARIAVPTLVLWGADDEIMPTWMANTIHDGVPDARLCLLAGAGHYPYADDPAGFTAAIRGFLLSPRSG